MSLQSRLALLITEVGNAFKSDRTRLAALEARLADRHVLSAPALQTVLGNTLTSVLTGNPVIDGGTYRCIVSYSWSRDNVSTSFRADFTINGTPPYSGPAFQIQEPKDNANQSGTQEAGTGTDQIQPLTHVFENLALPAGATAIDLQIGGASGGGAAENNIRDIYITLERMSL